MTRSRLRVPEHVRLEAVKFATWLIEQDHERQAGAARLAGKHFGGVSASTVRRWAVAQGRPLPSEAKETAADGSAQVDRLAWFVESVDSILEKLLAMLAADPSPTSVELSRLSTIVARSAALSRQLDRRRAQRETPAPLLQLVPRKPANGSA